MNANNNLIPRANLTKIPGELPKSKPDRYVEDLNKLTKAQLLEIKEREEKLLSNRLQISRLPDKGKKIKDFYEKVVKEIQSRDEVEQAAKLFSDLNIVSKGQNKLNHMEWNGKYDSNLEETIILDSDDENETNPLKIIAGNTSEKKVKVLKPEKLLITEEDLKEIESFKSDVTETVVNADIVEIDVNERLNAIKPKLEEKLSRNSSSPSSSSNSLNLEPHMLYLFEKEIEGNTHKEKFKPYKTTKSNVHDPEKEKLRKPLGKYWEVTAATPPPIQHSGVKTLPLQDSVEIQAQYLERLKKLQEKQAEERLAAKAARKSKLGHILNPDVNIFHLNSFFGSYRAVNEIDDDLYEREDENEKKIFSDDEVYDDDNGGKGEGGVIYTVYE